MRILKLHTTTSTNTYLKEWIRTNTPDNYTIVLTDEQTQGRGQRGNSWHSERDKNLIFSIFIKINQFRIDRQFELNQAISLAIITVLKNYHPSIQIKWPNDIMADNYKIGGILIENTVSNTILKHSIVGIGLNCNQTKFPATIPNVSSLKIILGKDIDLDELFLKISNSIKNHITTLENNSRDFFKQEYLENLFLWQKLAWYQDIDQNKFEGKIVGISTEGKLQIELTSKKIREFNLKEIKFLQLRHKDVKE